MAVQPERVLSCVAHNEDDSKQQSDLDGRMKCSNCSIEGLQIQHIFTLENVLATFHLQAVAESGGRRVSYVSSHDEAWLLPHTAFREGH